MVGRHVSDGCEYDPDTESTAYEGDAHNASTRSAWIVGAHGKWRLCESCAALPTFARLRRRVRVRP